MPVEFHVRYDIREVMGDIPKFPEPEPAPKPVEAPESTEPPMSLIDEMLADGTLF